MIKKFESWKNNMIDDNLFRSGKAKYNPQISRNKIKYKTGNIIPYYYASISKHINKFVCNIYKKSSDGGDELIKHKTEENLKNAHNYVREFLNQLLKKDKKLNKKDDKILNKSSKLDDIKNTNKYTNKDIEYSDELLFDPESENIKNIINNKTIIRRYDI